MTHLRISPVVAGVVVIWTALMVGAYFVARAQSVSAVATIALTEARVLADQIVDARTWNAGHGGVYVEVDENTQPNQYLEVPDREIETADHRLFTLVNPAFMTRQIAEIAARRHGTRVHLTSLKPIRPQNAPTDWERAALELFETGDSEWSGFAMADGRRSYRYVKALLTEEACLDCHGTQGYHQGDVRGGISVDFPIDSLARASEKYRSTIAVVLAVAWTLGLGVIAAVSHGFRQKQELVDDLERLSLTDDLTGLLNRRAFFKFGEMQLKLADRLKQQATILFFDLDNLKAINDSGGHREGDKALNATGKLLADTFRASDLISRFGGDEFVVLTFGRAVESAETTVARFRSLCDQHNELRGESDRFRVSVGWAPVNTDQPRALETAIAAADKRMYEDKA